MAVRLSSPPSQSDRHHQTSNPPVSLPQRDFHSSGSRAFVYLDQWRDTFRSVFKDVSPGNISPLG